MLLRPFHSRAVANDCDLNSVRNPPQMMIVAMPPSPGDLVHAESKPDDIGPSDFRALSHGRHWVS